MVAVILGAAACDNSAKPAPAAIGDTASTVCDGMAPAGRFVGHVTSIGSASAQFVVDAVDFVIPNDKPVPSLAISSSIDVTYRPAELALLHVGSRYRVTAFYMNTYQSWFRVPGNQGPCWESSWTTNSDGTAIWSP